MSRLTLGVLGLTSARAEAAPHLCRCTRRAECPRAEESGHWLWSLEESCVTITGAEPQNMSRRAQGEVRSPEGRTQGRAGDPHSLLFPAPVTGWAPVYPGQSRPRMVGVMESSSRVQGPSLHTSGGPMERESHTRCSGSRGAVLLIDSPARVPRPSRLGRGVRCELCGLPQVQLTISPLPALGEEDELLCLFGDSPAHPARVEGDIVVCNSPSSIPSTPSGQGEAPLSLLHTVGSLALPGAPPMTQSQGCGLKEGDRWHLPGWSMAEAHGWLGFWAPRAMQAVHRQHLPHPMAVSEREGLLSPSMCCFVTSQHHLGARPWVQALGSGVCAEPHSPPAPSSLRLVELSPVAGL